MKFTFDPPETGWTTNPNAVIIADPSAPTQPNTLSLNVGGVTPSCSRTLSGLTVGQTYDVWVRCNFDGVSTPFSAVARVIYNNGSSFEAFVRKTVGVTGWEIRQIGTLVYDQADRVLQFLGLGSATEPILIDSIYIGEEPTDELPVPDPAPEDDMALDREPIYAALFERLWAAFDWQNQKDLARKLKHWVDVPASEQIAMFLTTGDQTPKNELGVPPLWDIEPEVFIYFRLDDPDTIPGTQINAALKACEEALEWRVADVVPGTQFGGTMNGRQQTTLGGLVQFAWMGPVMTVEGVAQGQGALKFRVEMRAAALPAVA